MSKTGSFANDRATPLFPKSERQELWANLNKIKQSLAHHEGRAICPLREVKESYQQRKWQIIAERSQQQEKEGGRQTG